MKAHFALLTISAALSSPVHAADDVEQLVISHIVAIEGVRAIQRDRDCAYAARPMRLPDPPYPDILSVLSPRSRMQVEIELSKPQTKAKLAELGATGREVMVKMTEFSILDQRTRCGMWLGFAMSEYAKTGRALQMNARR